MTDRRTLAAPALLSVVMLVSGAARAQDDSAVEALVDMGKKLLNEGKLDEACAKLAEGNRLKSSARTLILLGKCHAAQGQTASAWAEYKQVARLTKGVSEEQLRYEEASKKVDELSGKLSYLSVVVTKKVTGLEVSRGDLVLSEASYSTELPVDPGKYTISARAPGYAPWSTSIEIKPGPDKQAVTIPALEPVAGGSTLGWVMVGAGAVATGAGLYFGLRARGTYKDAKNECPSLKGCSETTLSLRDKATTQANVANVAIGVGLLAVGLGVFLGVTSSGAKSEQASVVPILGLDQAGAAWRGTF